MSMHSFRAGKELQKELDYIQRTLGVNQSQAIAESIHRTYHHMREQERHEQSLLGVMQELNLIGCFEGEADLAERSKERYTESLKGKFRADQD